VKQEGSREEESKCIEDGRGKLGEFHVSESNGRFTLMVDNNSGTYTPSSRFPLPPHYFTCQKMLGSIEQPK
jgi:hypothetical protein